MERLYSGEKIESNGPLGRSADNPTFRERRLSGPTFIEPRLTLQVFDLMVARLSYNQFMPPRKHKWIAIFFGLLLLPSFARPESRKIEGTYRNPALGYSVLIPHGLIGIAGDEAGPERGVQISLPSGGKIIVFGEPNSLEWKSPEEGVKTGIPRACPTDSQLVKRTKVGKLDGVETSLVCGDHVFSVLLAFRNGGSPVYWLRLDTTRAHQSEDEAILKEVSASFKLIRWE